MTTATETDEEFKARMKAHFEANAAIVHRLRSQGWERWAAIDEADRILSGRDEAQQ